MTDDQINAAIAKACGWTDIYDHPEFGLMGVAPETCDCRTGIECYTHDLNAMHEAEKAILDINDGYGWELSQTECFTVWHATARQRAEAFLRTLGKWEEAQG